MDCLHKLIPEELVRHVQKYTRHPVCEDHYFTYRKNLKIHDKLFSGSLNLSPEQVLDLYATYWNKMFIYNCRDMNIQSGLTRRLDDKTGEWNRDIYGSEILFQYTTKIFNHPELIDYFKQMGFSPSKVALKWEIANSYVFNWLKELCQDEDVYKNFKRTDWYLRRYPCDFDCMSDIIFRPNIKMKKPVIQQFLTNNGITWRKTWNKKRLIQAWCKSE